MTGALVLILGAAAFVVGAHNKLTLAAFLLAAALVVVVIDGRRG